MKLFVGNLPWAATEDSLREFFEQVGEVVAVKIVMDSATGRSRGFGFVEMADTEQGEYAMSKLNEVAFLDRSIRVSPAENEKRPEPRRQNHRPPRGNSRDTSKE